VEKCYPVFYEHGEYSIRLNHLSSQDVETLRDLLKPLKVTLKNQGVNF